MAVPPTSGIYAQAWQLNGFSASTGQYSSASSVPPFGFIAADGDDNDNHELPNESLTVTVSSTDWSTSATYTGYTIGGAPVVYISSTNFAMSPGYYVLNNDASFSLTSGTATSTPDFVYCFARGTAIATPGGHMGVEGLNIGDHVLNAEGHAVAVQWIGRQTIHPLFAKLNGLLPVRIGAGALGEGLPARDLLVSPDHALLVDGCLVHAAALVNGRSIVQVENWTGTVEYFHIETAAHEIILAEGTPAETFIDNVSREKFDNFDEYAALYPDAAPMQELALPRVKFERQLPRAIRRRLDAVADALAAPQARAA